MEALNNAGFLKRPVLIDIDGIKVIVTHQAEDQWPRPGNVV
jgi:hypothetical protein